MARTPNREAESGRTTLNLSKKCKKLLIRLSEDEEIPMSKTIHRALEVYEQYLKTKKAQLEAGIGALENKGGKK